jgi:acetyltransferase-like isoleucine patch superfamily enzyme
MERILVAGGEGTGGNAWACIEDMRLRHGFEWRVEGFLNDALFSEEGCTIRGLPVVGRLDDASRFAREGYRFAFAIHPVGHGKLKEEAFARMGVPLESFVTVVHPMAFTAPGVTLEPGVVLCPGSCLMSGVRIGACSFVGTNVSFGHDVQAGPFCHFSNGAVVSSYSRIGRGCDVCLNATLLDMAVMEDYALLGSGSLLKGKADRRGVYVGSPAKAVKSVDDLPAYRLNPYEEAKRRSPSR